MILVVLVAATFMVMACGDEGVSTSFTPVDTSGTSAGQHYESPTSVSNEPGVTSPSSNEFFTILNKGELEQWRNCQTSTGKFDDGFDFTVRIDDPDVNYHIVQNVFWREDASCEPINGRGDGARPVSGSATLDDRGKHQVIGFRPSSNLCGGHYQYDVTIVNDDTGERHDIFFVALNTGREGKPGPCSPPENPTCEDITANITSEYETGEEAVCGVVTTSASNVDSCRVLENGEEVSDECNAGHQFCYERQEEGSADVLWRLLVQKGNLRCDPTTTIPVPPLGDPCEDSFLDLECEVYEVSNTLDCEVSSSSPGVLSALGVDKDFGAGNSSIYIPIPQDACGREFNVTASNQCEDTAKVEVETDECPECETDVSVRTREDGQTEIEWDVESNVPGGTVTIYVYRDGQLVRTLENQPREGRIVRPLDCNSAGEYRVVVVYENEEYDLYCEDEVEFEIDPCPEECVLPDEGTYELKTGSAQTECSQLGFDGVGKDESSPWNPPEGDFYLLKCGTDYELSYDPPTPNQADCSLIDHNISHVTSCECPPINEPPQ